MFFKGIHVVFNRIVDAEVDHFESCSFEHHSNQVFTNVMDIALDGTNHHFSDRRRAGFC